MSSDFQFRPRVTVVDSNIIVGQARDEMSPAPDAPTLLAKLDHHGVDGAIVHHAYAQVMSPIEGNELLFAAIMGYEDRLLPQCVAGSTRESLTQLQDYHSQGLLRSTRLHDVSGQGIPFASWIYGELLAWLEQEGIPLWIPLPEVDANQLVEALKYYPQLPVVLVGAHYQHTLLIRPLLQALPQVTLELSRHETLGDVEALSAEFGARRLLYGSWYPRYEIGPIIYYLHHTSLSEKELADVCAGNVQRLLKWEGHDDRRHGSN